MARTTPVTQQQEERRQRPRADRPVVSVAHRKLKGYTRTVDTWPAEMLWPLTKIKRYENNPRRNDDAVIYVVASLGDFGARQPIVVDEQGVIVVGDTRYLAALALRWPKYPVHVAHGLTPAEAKAYRLADNKVGERAEWDLPRLKSEFSGLRELGLDLALTGFRDYEIAPIMAAGELFTGGNGGEGGGGDSAGPSAPKMGQQVTFTAEQYATVQAACDAAPEGEGVPERLTAVCRVFLERPERP